MNYIKTCFAITAFITFKIYVVAQSTLKTQLYSIPTNFSYGFESNLINDKFKLIDMNGDGKPDLLDAENEATNPDDDVFMNNGQPCWKVYTNSASGFSANGVLWNIPKGFANGQEYILTSDEFTLIDMNGDKKPDLLDLENETTNPDDDVFVNGSQHYWRVYLNNGTGFSTSAIQWNIPSNFENGMEYKLNDEKFKLVDMNNDGKPDLLDTENEATNQDEDTFTNGTGIAWKIYWNTGTGFTLN